MTPNCSFIGAGLRAKSRFRQKDYTECLCMCVTTKCPSIKIFFEKRHKERVGWKTGMAGRSEVAVPSLLRTFSLGKFSGFDLSHEDHEYTNTFTF